MEVSLRRLHAFRFNGLQFPFAFPPKFFGFFFHFFDGPSRSFTCPLNGFLLKLRESELSGNISPLLSKGGPVIVDPPPQERKFPPPSCLVDYTPNSVHGPLFFAPLFGLACSCPQVLSFLPLTLVLQCMDLISDNEDCSFSPVVFA